MIRPINIYARSRIRDEQAFCIVEKHDTGHDEKKRIGNHEIDSLRLFVNKLIADDIKIENLDGFFYGFTIPQIGKEFDLLKINEIYCVNIELKSTKVDKSKILLQLLKNRHYLNHLGKRLSIYSIITDEMSCYKLSMNNELIEVDFSEIIKTLKLVENGYLRQIDDLFKASQYLVSPLNTPEKFIQGEYFLTQAQEQIKRELLEIIDKSFGEEYFHLTGKPGTGKTLLLYDIAKTLSKNGATAIVHCGKLIEGQSKISDEIDNLDILSVGAFKEEDFTLSKYQFILVDETHRIYEQQFNEICESVNKNFQICIFSSDPEQVLSSAEKRRDIVGKIRMLDLQKEFVLSEKIRTNKEINSFILNLKNLNHRSKIPMDYRSIILNYANTVDEAQRLLKYYRANGFKFINYSKSNYNESPFAAYEEDYDTHHVIGQEFDEVVMLMDASFFYSEDGELQGVPHPNPDYLYPNLFYQGITRVREKLAIIVVDNFELFSKIATILE